MKNSAGESRTSEVADTVHRAIDIAIGELKRLGAAGEVGAGYSEDWNAQVRLGQVETVQGSTTRGLRISAYLEGNRSGSTSITDVDAAAVRSAAAKAVELARFGDPDQWATLAILAAGPHPI